MPLLWKRTKVTVPVLLLFGAEDELVPPQATIAETLRILHEHGNPSVVVREFPGADHTLHVPPPDPDGWPKNAPGFLEALTQFAQGSGAATSR